MRWFITAVTLVWLVRQNFPAYDPRNLTYFTCTLMLSSILRKRTKKNKRFARTVYYRGADKSLARPGRKQARKHVRDARDFNKIKTPAVINFLFLQGKAPKEIQTILTETLACFLPGRAKDLSAPLYICERDPTRCTQCASVGLSHILNLEFIHLLI